MNILNLFVRTEKKIPSHLFMKQLIAKCLPDARHSLIILDHTHDVYDTDEEDGLTVWGTNAQTCAFKAWDSALARLGDTIHDYDYIIFSTSDFFPYSFELEKKLTQDLLMAFMGQAVALGNVSNSVKPLSVAGHLFKTWLCSDFFLLSPCIVRQLGTLAGVDNVDTLFCKQNDVPPFAALEVNGAYKEYLDAQFENLVDLWKYKYFTDDRIFGILQAKFVSVVQEHALTIRIERFKYRIVDLCTTPELKEMPACAPIAYICFNRPQTVAITLKALSEADLASKSDLHIFIDAPRNETDVPGIEAVLSLCTDEAITRCFQSVTMHRQTYNIGACEANRHAVKTMCVVSDNFIMLEDDVLFSPYALKYFNLALQKYKNMPTVFSISSARPPAMAVPEIYPWDAYFYPRTGIWGWASWTDRMRLVDWTASDVCAFEHSPMLVDAFNRGGSDMAPMLSSTVRASQLGWDIVMDFSRFKHGGVCLTPCHSYAINIGTDLSSVGSSPCNLEGQRTDNAVENPILPDFVVVDPQMEQATRDGVAALWRYKHTL